MENTKKISTKQKSISDFFKKPYHERLKDEIEFRSLVSKLEIKKQINKQDAELFRRGFYNKDYLFIKNYV